MTYQVLPISSIQGLRLPSLSKVASGTGVQSTVGPSQEQTHPSGVESSLGTWRETRLTVKSWNQWAGRSSKSGSTR